MQPTPDRSQTGTGTEEFLIGLFLGGLVLVISWFATLCIVGSAGVDILSENYQFPLTWLIIFCTFAAFSVRALRRHGFTATGFYAEIAVFVLLDGFCWSQLLVYRHA